MVLKYKSITQYSVLLYLKKSIYKILFLYNYFYLTYHKILKVRYSCVCVGPGVEYLTFNILLHEKSEQKMTGNQFCTPIISKNPLKTNLCIFHVILKNFNFKTVAFT